MRLLVVSDTHGHHSRLEKLLLREKADYYLHLGDGAEECGHLMETYPQKTILPVAGNCDSFSSFPASRLILLENQRIFMTHGHIFGVKYTMEHLIEEAKKQKASIALYGHTHKSSTMKQGGIWLMNPGSLGKPRDPEPTYGIIILKPEKVECRILPWKGTSDVL